MFSRVLRSSANTARLRTRHAGGARKFSVPPKAAKPCNGISQGSDDSHINSESLRIWDYWWGFHWVIYGVLKPRDRTSLFVRSLQHLIDKTDD